MTISVSTDIEELYQGTRLVLTCSLSVHSAVSTDYIVSITWRKNKFQVLKGHYVTISETEGSGHEYSSTVTFIPVDTSDSAIYICTASLSPSLTGSVIASSEVTDTIYIHVQSKFKFKAQNGCLCTGYFFRVERACGSHGGSYSHCWPDFL